MSREVGLRWWGSRSGRPVDADESVGRRQRRTTIEELSRPWSELTPQAEAQLKESFVAFRRRWGRLVRQSTRLESMIAAAERADSGALSQRPAQRGLR